MEWSQSQFIYNVTTAILDRSIEALFDMVSGVVNAFSLPLQAAAAIYIAMIGYSVMTGIISMSTRDLASRFAKVIAIVVIVEVFGNYGDALFNAVWNVPDEIAEFFVKQTAPILKLPDGVATLLTGGIGGILASGGDVSTLDDLTAMYSGLASILGDKVTEASSAESPKPFFTWVIAMVPMGLTIIGIYMAKFVAAVLFLFSPVVFLMSLTMGGFRGNAILIAWLKAIVLTFLTVIIVYTVGVICMVMMAKYIGALLVAAFLQDLPFAGIINFFTGGGGDEGFQYTFVQLTPMAIISLFSVILISQAASIASSLLGVAAIGTQQATSFMQIGALQAAK